MSFANIFSQLVMYFFIPLIEFSLCMSCTDMSVLVYTLKNRKQTLSLFCILDNTCRVLCMIEILNNDQLTN